MAHFEVYILNCNGERFLAPCLESLENLELGAHTLTVNVVDNGSTDRSAYLVKKLFPWANFIALGRNEGFSRGNNLGVWKRRGQLTKKGGGVDYHVFLNNDTTVEPTWLVEAAECLTSDPQRGIVGVKSLFMDYFLPIEFSAAKQFVPAMHGIDDGRELAFGLRNNGVSSHNFYEEPRTKYFNMYSPDSDIRWSRIESKVLAAIRNVKDPSLVSIPFILDLPLRIEQEVRVIIGGKDHQIQLRSNLEDSVTVEVGPSHYCRVIQNAGSYVTSDFDAGDVGFGTIDTGQFDTDREIGAVCGVSMFIRDDLFVKLGGFDERYFAYYEDTDLCLRARQLGYKCWYASKAVINHLHCGSGLEYSEYFNRNVTWSRLLFKSKFTDPRTWRITKNNLKKGVRPEYQEFAKDYSFEHRPHLRTWGRYLRQYPDFLKNRLGYRKNKKIPYFEDPLV